MRKLLPQLIFSASLLCAGLQSVSGQTPGTPDCTVQFDTGAGAAAGTYNFPGGNGYDNRTAGCVTWTLEWQSSLTPTLVFQSSLGVASPSSYGAYTGTTIFSGTGIDTYSNLQSGTVVDTPWVRVNITTGSTGQTKGVLYGYKTGTTGGTGGGGGGSGGGCSTPCPVKGSVAVGSAAAAPVTTGLENDAGNVVADHNFPNQADVTGSAVTAIKVVAGSAGKLIYVGHFSISLAAGTTVSIVQGTTSSTPCDTSAGTLAGPYQNTVALALDFTRDDPLTTTTTGDDLCLSFGASSTGGGLIKYSQR
jgi:hypothetical protein